MNSNLTTPREGELVQNIVGHWYRILEVRACNYRFLVQPLTMCGTRLVEVGVPCQVGRSELRIG